MLLDLHFHTTASDGVMSPRDVCKMAAKLNINIVATDHDTVKGQEALLKLCPESTAPGTYAMEVTWGVHTILASGETVPAHINVYCPFPFERYEINKECGEMPLAECVIRWAKERGCLAQWNHPLYWFYKLKPTKWGVLIKHIMNIKPHMIEVHNANETFISNKATRMMFKIRDALSAKKLSEETGIAFTSNTDAHVPQGFGVAFNAVPYAELDFDILAKAIKRADIVPVAFGKCSLCGKVWIASAWFDGTKLGKLLGPLRKLCGINRQSVEWIKVRWQSWKGGCS